MGLKQSLKNNKIIYSIYAKFMKSRFMYKNKMRRINNSYKKRFVRYSGAFHNSQMKELSYITWLYHVIEKGLSMPNMKPGFGKEKILELINQILSYVERYSLNDKAIVAAISTVFEYYRIHEESNLEIDAEVKQKIILLRNQFNDIPPLYQKSLNRNDILNNRNMDFSRFSFGRHSIRNFDQKINVSKSTILDAIEIAKNAPSACNRQPSRVYVVSNKQTINDCLALQNGNRGFGYLSNKLLVITGDLRTVLGPEELFDLNTNVGIFIMNLVYSLYYYSIGTCILNWYATPKQDKSLRKILNIPPYENIVALIACGYIEEELKIAESPRLESKDICHFVD